MSSLFEPQDGDQRSLDEVEKIVGNLSDAQRRQIGEKINEIRQFVPKIGVFGKTGAGKSHLCNALFGREVAQISDVGACTREPQNIVLASGGSGICLIDVPGVGESDIRDHEYKELYKSLLPELDIVLWVVKADDRALKGDMDVYKECVEPSKDKVPVVFVVNQVDKLSPIREWDVDNRKPGPKQSENIREKVDGISEFFGVESSAVCAVSAEEGYGLVGLVDQIVSTLPNEKKYGIIREAKEENVSKESTREAERGIWESVKGFFGAAIDFYKENKEAVHTVVAAVWSFFAKKK